MSLQCPVCAYPMPGHLGVCKACTDGLVRNLAAIPDLAADLELALTRQVRLGERGASGKAFSGGVLFDERARTAGHALKNTLVGWWRQLAGDERRPGPTCGGRCRHGSCLWIERSYPPADHLAAVSRWLLRQQAALLGHPAVVEVVEGVADAVRQAQAAIDRPPALWYAGPCGCGADLYGRHGAPVITCRACGAYVRSAEQVAWLMEQAADWLGTATEIARALHAWSEGITPERVRGYAHRGRIARRGCNEAGHPLYRLGDVLDIVRGGKGAA